MKGMASECRSLKRKTQTGEMDMKYHKSNFGSFSGGLQADIDGYVYTTIAELLSGNWDSAGGPMTRDMARDIARENREAVKAAERDIAEWQSS